MGSGWSQVSYRIRQHAKDQLENFGCQVSYFWESEIAGFQYELPFQKQKLQIKGG